MKEYVKALKNQGWSDEKVLADLETEASDVAKTSSNWTEWRNTMEKWTDDVNKWSNDDDEQEEKISLDINEIEEQAISTAKDVMMFFDLVKYLSVPFGANDEKSLLKEFLAGIDTYFNEQIAAFKGEYLINDEVLDIESLEPIPPMTKQISGFLKLSNIDSGLKFYIDDLCFHYFTHWMESLYFPSIGIHNDKDAVLFKGYYDNTLKAELSKVENI